MESFIPAEPRGENSGRATMRFADLSRRSAERVGDGIDDRRHLRPPDGALRARMIVAPQFRLDDLPHRRDPFFGAEVELPLDLVEKPLLGGQRLLDVRLLVLSPILGLVEERGDLADLEKVAAIEIVAKDFAPLIAARGDVKDSAGKLDSHRSCHAARLPRYVTISAESAETVTKPAINLLGMETPANGIYEW